MALKKFRGLSILYGPHAGTEREQSDPTRTRFEPITFYLDRQHGPQKYSGASRLCMGPMRGPNGNNLIPFGPISNQSLLLGSAKRPSKSFGARDTQITPAICPLMADVGWLKLNSELSWRCLRCLPAMVDVGLLNLDNSLSWRLMRWPMRTGSTRVLHPPRPLRDGQCGLAQIYHGAPCDAS